MKNPKILLSSNEFTTEFIRCCNNYTKLSIAVAWCGNPEKILPFKYLEDFYGKIDVIVGTSFYHTHPNAFSWLNKMGANFRVFDKEIDFFHPKIYLFTKKNKYALFIGSSNLTTNGFYENIEANSLVEGSYSSKTNNEITKLINKIKEWRTNKYSFRLTNNWLKDYKKKYNNKAKKERDAGIKSQRRAEEEIGTASWLRNADWKTYYSELKKSIIKYNRDPNDYFKVLDDARNKLTTTWRTSYFEDIKKRRIIGGFGRGYEMFGVVTASGRFNHLLKSGPEKDWKAVVKSINTISKMESPINWNKLNLELNKLEKLGFTMRIWGRLLCITRPDLFCTISSVSVRQNLSDLLHMTEDKIH